MRPKYMKLLKYNVHNMVYSMNESKHTPQMEGGYKEDLRFCLASIFSNLCKGINNINHKNAQ